MDMERKGAGAVIIAADGNKLKQWILSAMQDYQMEYHGSKYSQRFISFKVNDLCSVCFYAISGYDSHSENIAFEHSEFVLDEFLEALSENSFPDEHLAFVDVGGNIEDGEFIGFKSLEEGLLYFKIDLKSIESLRENLPSEGEVILEILDSQS